MHRLSCLALLSAASAWATPVTYTEPPDLADSGGPTFILEVGINTITGSVNGCNNCAGDFADSFSLTLPVGLIVTSAFFSATNFNGGGANPTLGCFTQAGCFGTGFFSGMTLAPGTTAFTATSPYAQLAGSVTVPGSYDYILSYTVASAGVPEPSTAIAVVSALAGLVLIRRRNSD
jgi:hypothetical protein